MIGASYNGYMAVAVGAQYLHQEDLFAFDDQ